MLLSWNTFLNENACAAKGFVLALALAWLGVGLPAQDLSPTAQAANTRFFLMAMAQDSKAMFLAPGSWTAGDWGMALVPAAGLAVVLAEDPKAYAQLRGQQAWLDWSMPLATDAGDGLYSSLGVAALWGGSALLGQNQLCASSASAMESLAICAVLSPAIKYSFAAPRPSYDDQTRTFFNYAYPDGSPSFPSGHTLVAFSLAEVYGDAYGRWWTYPLAACIGYSRIYLGAHWPSDVLAGALLGACIGHFALKGQKASGTPSLWNFSLLPRSGGALAMASRAY